MEKVLLKELELVDSALFNAMKKSQYDEIMNIIADSEGRLTRQGYSVNGTYLTSLAYRYDESEFLCIANAMLVEIAKEYQRSIEWEARKERVDKVNKILALTQRLNA